MLVRVLDIVLPGSLVHTMYSIILDDVPLGTTENKLMYLLMDAEECTPRTTVRALHLPVDLIFSCTYIQKLLFFYLCMIKVST